MEKRFEKASLAKWKTCGASAVLAETRARAQGLSEKAF